MKLLLMMMWMSSMTFIFMMHPLSMGLILLIQTFFIALITGLMSMTFWFSYIIFLIMVGGMLILFMYMTSIASNEKFKFSYKLMMLLMIMASITLMMFLMDQYSETLNINTFEIKEWKSKFINETSMTKFINWPSLSMMLTIIIYLLITLIAVVKITNIKGGPLRQMF